MPDLRISFLLSLLALSAADLDAAPPSGSSWRLAFEDNFDGTSLDTTKWSYHYPWSRTHNHDAYSKPENVSVDNGILTLTALKENAGGKPYTTGVVNTNAQFRFTHGYIEARMRMPASRGSWPAFWMLQDGWPPEIDIMEFPLADTSQNHNEKYRYWWNYHYGDGWQNHKSFGGERWQGADLTAGYHDYGVEWSDGQLRFYLDGNLQATVSNTSAVNESANMYMILNYAVGGWPGDPPSWPADGDRFRIDWVRVWKTGASSTSTWSRDGDGDWDNGNHWSGGTPSLASQRAVFGQLPNASRSTVDWRGPRTVGHLEFEGTSSYILGSGDETVILARRGDTDHANLVSRSTGGTQRITANLELHSDTDIALTNPLTLTGSLHGSGDLNLNAGTLSLTGLSYHSGDTNITGPATTLRATTGLYGPGAESVGTTTVSAGATLAMPALDTPGILVLDGGTLALTASTGYSTKRLTIGPAGATLDIAANHSAYHAGVIDTTTGGPLVLTGAGTATLATPLTGDTRLTKAGPGTWTLTGTQSHNAVTDITAGTLSLDGATLTNSPSVAVRAGATLRASDATIANRLAFEPGATLHLVADTTTPALTTGPGTTLNGATLKLTLAPTFTPTPPLTTIPLLAGTHTGTFADLALPAIPNTRWDTSQLDTGGTVTLIGTPPANALNLVTQGSPSKSAITSVSPTWNALSFNDSTWTTGTTAIGYDEDPDYRPFLGTDLIAPMLDTTTSAFIRIPFNLPNRRAFTRLTLDIQYDDGFVAYLNGTEVARALAPDGPLTIDSRATASHPDADAVTPQTFDLTPHVPGLRDGPNVLAIHGLNVSPGSSDFLIAPTLTFHGLPVPADYPAWAAAYAVTTPDADPDNDHRTTLAEFLDNTDPTSPDTPLHPPLQINPQTGTLALTFHRRTDIPNLTTTLESSTDGLTWQPAPLDITATTPTPDPNFTQIHATTPTPQTSTTTLYRLRFTL